MARDPGDAVYRVTRGEDYAVIDVSARGIVTHAPPDWAILHQPWWQVRTRLEAEGAEVVLSDGRT